MTNNQNIGLYTPSLERDSCGVGMLADLNNNPSNYIIDSALSMLENMEHRGAYGAEKNTGDGAGILVQIPHDFFWKKLQAKNVLLPGRGKYGMGMFFFPKDKKQRKLCLEKIQETCAERNIDILHQRAVPVDNSFIGISARDTEPQMIQLFFGTAGQKGKKLEQTYYLLRTTIMNEVYRAYPELADAFYVASLSAKTIVYKGQLSATQLRAYFMDLQDTAFKSAVAIVHSRFSTNTLPKWKLAQPFRCIAHNGEINTIQGNINWWQAREKHIEEVSQDQPQLSQVFPVCDPYISDSGNFDNVVDFLIRAGRSIPQVLMMMIPEAWQYDKQMADYKRAFYEYHDAIMEPWDGPASICFTDGTLLGATLDRNGLRPSRYLLTSDNLLVLGSEAGCLNIEPDRIIKKGRLQPGKMLVADLDENRIISDDELKATICRRKPYRQWLDKYAKHISDLKNQPSEKTSPLSLQQRKVAFGFSQEDEDLILQAMGREGKEPIGSMGADIPLAVLSKIAQHPANYFKQQFAQVTNPPIDSLREKFFMSLSTAIGGGSLIIGTGDREAGVIRFDTPVLTRQQLTDLMDSGHESFQSACLDTVFPRTESLQQAIEDLCQKAISLIHTGTKVVRLSDRNIRPDLLTVPSLLITGALHHKLIKLGLRKEVTLLIDAGDIWETQHVATLLSYGADLICPYLALEAVEHLAAQTDIPEFEATKKYIRALDKGLLKIMSKLGVSTLNSYKGAQTFEALGIAQEVVDVCFKGTISRIGGMRFRDLEKELRVKHDYAFSLSAKAKSNGPLPDTGVFQWKRRGEYHLFNPTSIHLLQYASRSNDYEVYRKYATNIDKLEQNASTLRSYLRIKKANPIPIEEVESVSAILKRFATGAMSFGSISKEAHTTIAKAMNRIGGKSNSGEGGEDESRFQPLSNGDSERSAIKQIASGRFGVSINYLTNADELQIKMAQGAKPGEGGQLPGHKVDKNIAKVRHSTPGVDLISPPPHHDIYSIEDLAQLIFDLKNANKQARISVKLVAKTGVGVIASGVVKAHADHILISGHDGGTGASPLSSIRHAGLPWEIGLSETHQTLVLNGLRDRVVLQTDGQIRTGRDLAVATMLGAEEWGIATAALVVQGCILMRKCHLNTCPVGIATQDEKLRKKFNGKVEHLVNYFHFLAQHLREIMAEVGVRTVNELVGRTDLLEIKGTEKHWKTKNLNLESILKKQPNLYACKMYQTKPQDHGLRHILDKKLIYYSRLALQSGSSYQSVFPVISTDRAVGTMLSHEIARKYGSMGMPDNSLSFRFRGSAGQSFGAFAVHGLSFKLEGEANDYFGKGLSGAKLAVSPDRDSQFDPSTNVIIGNVALYGATSGEAYINGKAGDRFCVRNSGAEAVVEGIGDNGCEYMTGGKTVILGPFGRNFGAGMSGGIAYLFNHDKKQLKQINREMVLIEKPDQAELADLRRLIRNHYTHTGSKKALRILQDWERQATQFIRVIPEAYKRIMQERKFQHPLQTSTAL
ncbi:MAG: glutamate synthase large subunit [Bacteroidetes bacterium]|nr:glutamate synthase large subunit [Bacteroidota bacterium]